MPSTPAEPASASNSSTSCRPCRKRKPTYKAVQSSSPSTSRKSHTPILSDHDDTTSVDTDNNTSLECDNSSYDSDITNSEQPPEDQSQDDTPEVTIDLLRSSTVTTGAVKDNTHPIIMKFITNTLNYLYLHHQKNAIIGKQLAILNITFK